MKEKNIAEKVTDYVERHLSEDLSLEKIAKELNYSKYYMERAFVQQTGCTVCRYIQERRLALAAQQLAETDKPIIEIAYDAHYASQQAFTQAFRRQYLCTPQTYRKNNAFYAPQSSLSLCGFGRRRQDMGCGGKARMAA